MVFNITGLDKITEEMNVDEERKAWVKFLGGSSINIKRIGRERETGKKVNEKCNQQGKRKTRCMGSMEAK